MLPSSIPSSNVCLTPHGVMGDRIDRMLQQWIIPAPYTNPLMFEQLRMRDRTPQLLLQAWHGEFPGKHLTAAVALYAMTQNAELRKTIEYMVDRLTECQGEDGYLGIWPKEQRLCGKMNPVVLENAPHWDCWSHYHIMLGLYHWYKLSGCEKAWNVCLRAAECVCDYFLAGDKFVYQCGVNEANNAIGHIFALLYRETNTPRFLEMAQHVLKCFEHESCGDYYRAGLANTPFYATRKPRWESLHSVQQLYEMYAITGDESFRTAFENLCESMITDRHATGGFTSSESTKGSPYDMGAIETCCTVAWIVLNCDRLLLNKESRIADELELSTWNGMLGAMHPSGRYFVYNAPMIGEKRSSTQDIVFQAAAGGSELGCCSVNGGRGLGVLGLWGAIVQQNRVFINYYGAGCLKIQMNGEELHLIQETEYPRHGLIRFRVEKAPAVPVMLSFRIPGWSHDTSIKVGDEVMHPAPGRYADIEKAWKTGDTVELELDMRPHLWVGEEEAEGKCAWYRGPVTLTYDMRFNAWDLNHIPAVSSLDNFELVENTDPLFPAPIVLLRGKADDGSEVTLCDYATAGATGTSFTIWMPGNAPLEPLPAKDWNIWMRLEKG